MTLTVSKMSSGYRGVPVLKDINFTINAGEIVGLIGLNGAGKSTLLKTILGLIKPLTGTLTINNHSLIEQQANYVKALAYIPETPVLYEELTLKEHLEMTALGYQLPIEMVLERAMPLLKLFRLDQYLNWFPIHFSKGMKQKVMIVCAFVTDATVMIIDEPFLGLDPLAINHFTRLMKERAAQGTAIIFTTHVLSIAEQLCDRYMMLQKGQIVADGQLLALQQQLNQPNATLDELYVEMTEAVE